MTTKSIETIGDAVVDKPGAINLKDKVFSSLTFTFHGLEIVVEKKWDGEEYLNVYLKRNDKTLHNAERFKLDAFENTRSKGRLRKIISNHLPLNPENLEQEFESILSEHWKDIQRIKNTHVEVPEDEKDKIKRTSFLNDKGILIQQVYDIENDTRFVVYDGKHFTFNKKYIIGDKTYLPLDGEEIEKGFVNLATHPIDYESLEQLVSEISEWSKKYIDIPNWFREFSAYYVAFSWVYDIGNAVPYLRFLGDTGCGKTRGLDVFGSLCYNSIHMSGAATLSPIFRIMQKWGGTLLVEEADVKGTDETNEFIKIINCGIERRKPVLRCDPINPANVNFFDPYCPKIFAMRKNFSDMATEGRCLTTTMQETERKDIPPILMSDFYTKAQEFRNKLLMFRLKNFNQLNPSPDNILPIDLEPRLKQMALPLLIIFKGKDDSAYKRFETFLLAYQKKLREIRASSFTGMVVSMLRDVLSDREDNGEDTPITCKELADELKATNADVSREIRALGFKTEVRHASAKIKNKDGDITTKRKTFRAIVCSDDVWSSICKRYVIDGASLEVKPDILEPIHKSEDDLEKAMNNINYTPPTQNGVPAVPAVPHVPKDEKSQEVDVPNGVPPVPKSDFLGVGTPGTLGTQFRGVGGKDIENNKVGGDFP